MENENTNKKGEAALREEKVLEFWRENNIFEKSLTQRQGRKEFIFYEGPPTANGKPGIHHLAARAFKDAVPRYKTMRGYHVRRKGGWDTHGLPVELQVEKKLGLNSKKAIEEYGIAKFNQECKESVWEYLDVWNKFTKRIGYWVDQKNPYVTYDNNFIESVWNVVKKTNEQGLLYKDYKVVPWCPRCGTALSSHELAQGYEDVKDLSVYVKFKVKGQVNTYLLAWTTTPWTLPGNVALAVGKDIRYVKIKPKDSEEVYILAKDLLLKLFPEFNGVELNYVDGSSLVGLEYEPLFPFLADTIGESEKPKLDKAYRVYEADFVNTEDGTGIVHTAVMYGQDDFVLGTKVGLPKHHLVNLEGKFVKGTGFLEGRFVKEVDENGKPTLAVDIIKYLTERNLFFKKENYEHSYPHCWRCKTALIYYARDSWYVRMSDPRIKERLIAENKGINWEPSHIREGRFGEWLKEIKDWAISRERYWGTPLPVWECNKCNKRNIIGGFEEMQDKTKKSGNTYFLMRHGQTSNNLKNLVSTVVKSGSYLTEEGEKRTKETAEMLKNEGIDMIFVSPYDRTQETAEIVKDVIGLKAGSVVVDDRLGEMKIPSYEGKLWDEYHNDFPKTLEHFEKSKEGEESLQDVKARMMEFLFDIEDKYRNKKILIVTHGGPAWLLTAGAKMLNTEKTLALIWGKKDFHFFQNSEVQKLPFVFFPHNKKGDFDTHRPFIDEVKLTCDCGGEQSRTKEVMDVWLDSGCMPFAQDHYPFENKEWIEGEGYPADYICEAIDQTRGWFYTLHAVGVLMGRGKAYKNVICLGHLLDAKGKKMSKSLGNVVEPFEAMDKYGVDTLRLWMYGVNQPGESKNFDEKTVMLLQQQVFGLLYNVLAFYELYRDKTLENNVRPRSSNVLDRWILARLDELIDLMTKNLDGYKLLEPTRALRDFIGDLSTWYVRRSRERIKNGDKEAKVTLYHILKTVSKLMAPFAPFAAEDIWLNLRNEGDKESVHLENWPQKTIFGRMGVILSGGRVKKIVIDMKMAREIVSIGLKERQIRNLPVKQPLRKIRLKIRLPRGLKSIIGEELNVKEVEEDSNLKEEVSLDTDITPELKQEGGYRELVRTLQDLRKKLGLKPNEIVKLSFNTNDEGKLLMDKFSEDLKKSVLVSEIEYKENDGQEILVGSLSFKVKIEK